MCQTICGVGIKPKQLKRLKKRHRQQRLSLFLRQACPKSKGVKTMNNQTFKVGDKVYYPNHGD